MDNTETEPSSSKAYQIIIYIYIYIHHTRHFNNKCRHPQNPNAFLKTQPIEQICVENESKLDQTLWHREKYWQALLFTNSHGMNSLADLYSKKRKGYRKK